MLTRRSLALVGAVFCASLAGAWAEEAKATKAVVWGAGELKWVDAGATKGAQIAVLKGDPKTGAYEALKRVPGGTNLGWHTHTRGQEVLMVSGTMELEVEGVGKKELTAGAWATLSGGVRHVAACKAGADCVYFEDSDGPADFKPAEAPKK